MQRNTEKAKEAPLKTDSSHTRSTVESLNSWSEVFDPKCVSGMVDTPYPAMNSAD